MGSTTTIAVRRKPWAGPGAGPEAAPGAGLEVLQDLRITGRPTGEESLEGKIKDGKDSSSSMQNFIRFI